MRSEKFDRRTWARRVRLDNNFRADGASPTFLMLIILRGLTGVAFLCFGELFWMHLSRIGLEGEAKVLGSIALILGVGTATGAICGAAGFSVRLSYSCNLVFLFITGILYS